MELSSTRLAIGRGPAMERDWLGGSRTHYLIQRKHGRRFPKQQLATWVALLVWLQPRQLEAGTLPRRAVFVLPYPATGPAAAGFCRYGSPRCDTDPSVQDLEVFTVFPCLPFFYFALLCQRAFDVRVRMERSTWTDELHSCVLNWADVFCE